MTERAHPALKVFSAAVGVLLVAPTLIVVPMAFTSASTFQFPPPGFSTRWFGEFFSDPNWIDSAVLSLQVGAVVTVLATVLGTVASFALVRGVGVWRTPARAFLLAPMIVPGVIVAIGIYAVFLKWKLTATFQGFVLAHLVLAVPLVIIPVSAALQTLDGRLEQAAAGLGATPARTFFHVTLPLIMPAMLTGALFAFLTSFDEAIVSLFISGPFERTLPVQLYQSVTSSLTPTIAAASTLVIALTTSLLFVAAIIASRRRIRHA